MALGLSPMFWTEILSLGPRMNCTVPRSLFLTQEDVGSMEKALGGVQAGWGLPPTRGVDGVAEGESSL